MTQHDLIVDQEEAMLLDQCLTRFVEDTGIRLALLMGRDGYSLAKHGDWEKYDLESLCALSRRRFRLLGSTRTPGGRRYLQFDLPSGGALPCFYQFGRRFASHARRFRL